MASTLSTGPDNRAVTVGVDELAVLYCHAGNLDIEAEVDHMQRRCLMV